MDRDVTPDRAAVVRVKVNVREPLADGLKDRAERDGKTFTQVLQEAIALKLFADDARDHGDRLLLLKSDGSTHEVRFTNGGAAGTGEHGEADDRAVRTPSTKEQP